MTERAVPDADPLVPLWRAAQVFRLASLVYAVGILATSTDRIDRPLLAWLLMAVQIGWTGVAVTAFSIAGPRRSLVVLDVVLTVALVLASWLASPPATWEGHDVLPTQLWAANAIVSVALFWGRRAGLVIAVVVALTCNLVTGDLYASLWRNATVPVLICVGLAVGTLARTATRANDQLRAAVELRAATEERDRLARQVHDGALQVLSLVARRGGRVDTELAGLAATQEQALRRLLGQRSPASRMPAGLGTLDVGAALTALEGPAVAVSAPQDPVLLEASAANELVAAIREALHNVEEHAGDGARAFLLLEDLGTEVVATVRDDGPGIPAGRLSQAAAQGRLGVSQSIRRRVESLGGTAVLESREGEGVEWELRIPRRQEAT